MEAKSGFYRHLAVYVVVNLLLVGINLVTPHDSFWAIWPLLGWGIGIAFHALRAFAVDGSRRHHPAHHHHG